MGFEIAANLSAGRHHQVISADGGVAADLSTDRRHACKRRQIPAYVAADLAVRAKTEQIAGDRGLAALAEILTPGIHASVYFTVQVKPLREGDHVAANCAFNFRVLQSKKYVALDVAADHQFAAS